MLSLTVSGSDSESMAIAYTTTIATLIAILSVSLRKVGLHFIRFLAKLDLYAHLSRSIMFTVGYSIVVDFSVVVLSLAVSGWAESLIKNIY